jgi:hypothetical protein
MSVKEESGLDFDIKINDSLNNQQIKNNNNSENNSNINNNNNQNDNNNNNNNDISITNFYKKSSNPIVSILTVFFKFLSIFLFLFMNLFVSNESYTIITVIISGSIDFWYTKNISGRILVGLRWWNQIKSNGQEVWIYESKNEQDLNKINSKIFWDSLYTNTFIWVVLSFWELIRFKFMWGTLTVIMLILSGTNLFSFIKCSELQRKNIVEFSKRFGKKIVKDVGKEVIANQLY